MKETIKSYPVVSYTTGFGETKNVLHNPTKSLMVGGQTEAIKRLATSKMPLFNISNWGGIIRSDKN